MVVCGLPAPAAFTQHKRSSALAFFLQMGSVDDNGSGGSYAYRASKAALNIINKSLSIDLAGDGVTCVLLHPGTAAAAVHPMLRAGRDADNQLLCSSTQ